LNFHVPSKSLAAKAAQVVPPSKPLQLSTIDFDFDAAEKRFEHRFGHPTQRGTLATSASNEPVPLSVRSRP
jgi:hypothetical protein